MSLDHNPQAFATPPLYNPNTGDYIHGEPGMSLRDWFAGQALSGLLGNSGRFIHDASVAARDAYRTADAMLDVRSRGYAPEARRDAALPLPAEVMIPTPPSIPTPIPVSIRTQAILLGAAFAVSIAIVIFMLVPR